MPADFDLAATLRRGAIVAGFSAVVAIGLIIARGSDWLVQFVYAEAIGLAIWAAMDFGRFLFERDAESHWPTGWRNIVLRVGGVTFGYAAGTWLGDRYCGCSTFALWQGSGRAFFGYLVLSIAITAAISYFFFARSRDQLRLRRIAVAEREASQAQLKLLEAQLEPHMLFNTLANLRALIAVDPPRAQAMLDRLIGFLRATLSGSRQPMHSLGAEFARVADYLELMRMRMGERLQSRLDLPEELAGVPVPPLILQPLVENAIKHGLEPHVAGGRIEISAERTGDRLVLHVRDTGAGLADAQAPSASPGQRFGLEHVRQRLDAVYGDGARFELAPAADARGGTSATVTIRIDDAVGGRGMAMKRADAADDAHSRTPLAAERSR